MCHHHSSTSEDVPTSVGGYPKMATTMLLPVKTGGTTTVCFEAPKNDPNGNPYDYDHLFKPAIENSTPAGDDDGVIPAGDSVADSDPSDDTITGCIEGVPFRDYVLPLTGSPGSLTIKHKDDGGELEGDMQGPTDSGGVPGNIAGCWALGLPFSSDEPLWTVAASATVSVDPHPSDPDKVWISVTENYSVDAQSDAARDLVTEKHHEHFDLDGIVRRGIEGTIEDGITKD